MSNSALAEKLAYTEQPQYGHITNESEAIDSTFSTLLPIGLGLNAKNIIKGIFRKPDWTNTEYLISKFFDRNNPYLEDAPPNYEEGANFKDIINYLGSKDGESANLETPIEQIIFNNRNVPHFYNDNEIERLKFLSRLKRTFEDPYYIVKEQRDGKDYNGYYKPFRDNERVDGYFGIAKNVEDGTFYSTGRPIRAKNLREKLNEGQTIYNRLSDRTAPIPKDMPVNNIINQNAGNFNGLNNIVEQIKQFFRK